WKEDVMARGNGVLSSDERIAEFVRLAALDADYEYPFAATAAALALGISRVELDRAVRRARKPSRKGAGAAVSGQAQQDPKGFLTAALLPELVIERSNLPDAAFQLRDRLSVSGRLYDRGGPAMIVKDPRGVPVVVLLGVDHVVMEAHGV